MNIGKQVKKELAKRVSQHALDGVSLGAAPTKVERVAAEMVAEKVTKQNPLRKSKRFYSLLAAGVALGAGWFGMNIEAAEVVQLLELSGAAAAAVLVAWDKFSDIRDVRS